MGAYYVDFVCLERHLVIELDGGQHVDRVAYDKRRTSFLRSMGFRVVRYWNDDVLMHTGPVLEDLMLHLGSDAPHPHPVSTSGEREEQ